MIAIAIVRTVLATVWPMHSFSTPDLTPQTVLPYNPLVIPFSKPVDWFRFLQLSQLFLLERGSKNGN